MSMNKIQITQKTAIGLIRVSTEEQAEDGRGGIPRQRTAILRVAQQHNLNLVRIDEVIDVSGTNVKNSPIFQKILGEVQNRVVDGVVVAELDRLMRPEKYSDYSILDVFKESGAQIWTENNVYDNSTPIGTLQSLIFGAFAGFDRANILAKTQGAKEAKRKMGQCPSASITLPRGVAYDRKEAKWEYTVDVEAVKEAFRIVDEEGLTNMCELGKRVGIKPRTLSNLLRNPLYMGVRVYDKKRGAEKYPSLDGRQADRKKVPRSDDEIIRIKVFDEGAISEGLFERVQLSLSKVHTRWRSARVTVEINPLAGIAICGRCGMRIYGTSGKKKTGARIGYYICAQNYYLNKRKGLSCEQKSIHKDDLEETTRAFITDYLGNPETIVRISEKLQSGVAQAQSTANFSKMLKDLELRKKRLLEAVESGSIPQSEVGPRYEELSQQQLAVEQMMLNTEDRHQSAAKTTRIVERLIRSAHAFRRQFNKEELRKFLQSMFSSISYLDCKIVGFELSPAFLEFSDIHVSCTKKRIRMDRGSSRLPA